MRKRSDSNNECFVCECVMQRSGIDISGESGSTHARSGNQPHVLVKIHI
ncbi:hypothetical protein [Lysinibacillus sp. fls2-241-R2A-57]|nr:hypothetical protein [Lysinibacillus sp. fls2-241-R2A-57]